MKVWFGIAEGAGYTAVVLEYSETAARRKLYQEWKKLVDNNWRLENRVRSFEQMCEMVGAAVVQVEMGTSFVWEQTR